MGIVAVVAAVLSIEASGGWELTYVIIAIIFGLLTLLAEVSA